MQRNFPINTDHIKFVIAVRKFYEFSTIFSYSIVVPNAIFGRIHATARQLENVRVFNQYKFYVLHSVVKC